MIQSVKAMIAGFSLVHIGTAAPQHYMVAKSWGMKLLLANRLDTANTLNSDFHLGKKMFLYVVLRGCIRVS